MLSSIGTTYASRRLVTAPAQVFTAEELIAFQSKRDRVVKRSGDILFSLVNYARFIKIDPETALERVNIKFKKRFEYIEAHAPKDLNDMTLAEMDLLWEAAKKA
jgi:uncharacterized protein YabN with tetrapyrrole methylase and pyrophosphatase domain